jgi:hypothetical protein
MESDKTLGTVLRAINDSPETIDTLKQITSWEREHFSDKDFAVLGWEWKTFDPPIKPQTLHRLHMNGILRLVYSSNSSKGYITNDPAAILKALKIYDAERAEMVQATNEDTPPVKIDLFESIIGYDDVKEILVQALNHRASVHWSLVGPAASSKTLFLMALEQLPGASYVLGSRMSKAGLSDLLLTFKPKILLIDEVDKLPRRDVAPLLSLCETGRVIETLYGRHKGITLDTVVFTAANRIDYVAPEILSRFEVLQFTEYTRDQFLELSMRLLPREGVDPMLGKYIGVQVWDVLRNRDIREAVRIARLANSKEAVDRLVGVLDRYRPKRPRER